MAHNMTAEQRKARRARIRATRRNDFTGRELANYLASCKQDSNDAAKAAKAAKREKKQIQRDAALNHEKCAKCNRTDAVFTNRVDLAEVTRQQAIDKACGRY